MQVRIERLEMGKRNCTQICRLPFFGHSNSKYDVKFDLGFLPIASPIRAVCVIAHMFYASVCPYTFMLSKLNLLGYDLL